MQALSFLNIISHFSVIIIIITIIIIRPAATAVKCGCLLLKVVETFPLKWLKHMLCPC